MESVVVIYRLYYWFKAKQQNSGGVWLRTGAGQVGIRKVASSIPGYLLVECRGVTAPVALRG